MMILPRQAWNKRTNETLNNGRSMASADSHRGVDDSRRASGRAAQGRSAGKKTALLSAHFISKNDQFAKSGSGQTWKKLQKRGRPFSCRLPRRGWISVRREQPTTRCRHRFFVAAHSCLFVCPEPGLVNLLRDSYGKLGAMSAFRLTAGLVLARPVPKVRGRAAGVANNATAGLRGGSRQDAVTRALPHQLGTKAHQG